MEGVEISEGPSMATRRSWSLLEYERDARRPLRTVKGPRVFMGRTETATARRSAHVGKRDGGDGGATTVDLGRSGDIDRSRASANRLRTMFAILLKQSQLLTYCST